MKKKNNISLYLTVIFAVALLIGIGYAALTTTLNINGQATIHKASWDLHFENISANTTDVKFYSATDSALSNPISAGLIDSTNTLRYSIDLKMDGQTHNVSFDIVNGGTIDAEISNLPGWLETPRADITSNQKVNGQYTYGYMFDRLTKGTCKYSDNTIIKTGDVIRAGDSKTVVCSHHMKTGNELTNSDLELWSSLTTSTLTGTFDIDINFIQAAQNN